MATATAMPGNRDGAARCAADEGDAKRGDVMRAGIVRRVVMRRDKWLGQWVLLMAVGVVCGQLDFINDNCSHYYSQVALISPGVSGQIRPRF
jgi:hypothetical protein